jgi:hypothetical protein
MSGFRSPLFILGISRSATVPDPTVLSPTAVVLGNNGVTTVALSNSGRTTVTLANDGVTTAT